MDIPRKALVVGATGATGKQVVDQLLQSDHWEQVTTIARRSLNDTLMSHYKLNHYIVDFEQIDTLSHIFKEVDWVFHCIGTTRKQAETADHFIRIEKEYSETIAKLASQAGVQGVSVVSAQGANPHLPRVSWPHFILYSKTMADKESAFWYENFERVSVFRPGMLNRLSDIRSSEKLFVKLFRALPVNILAKAMIKDASTPMAERRIMISGNRKIMQRSED